MERVLGLLALGRVEDVRLEERDARRPRAGAARAAAARCPRGRPGRRSSAAAPRPSPARAAGGPGRRRSPRSRPGPSRAARGSTTRRRAADRSASGTRSRHRGRRRRAGAAARAGGCRRARPAGAAGSPPRVSSRSPGRSASVQSRCSQSGWWRCQVSRSPRTGTAPRRARSGGRPAGSRRGRPARRGTRANARSSAVSMSNDRSRRHLVAAHVVGLQAALDDVAPERVHRAVPHPERSSSCDGVSRSSSRYGQQAVALEALQLQRVVGRVGDGRR